MSTVVVDPVTRIEGHLRIEAETENGIITRAMSSGTMLRGIENVLTGRDPRDAWAIAQRICGVCTLVHGIASVRAVENALGYPIPPNAELIRNLMIGAQFVHDHVMHFYHLHALDWVDVVSALSADPAAAADLQQCLSPWPNSSAAYFADVKSRLSTFVGSGQLGIFANGYWGHPEYKLPPELNLLAFAHYLEALAWQRGAARLLALFGGKNPHPNFIVGGAPCVVDGKAGQTALDTKGRVLLRQIITDMRNFVDQVYLPDTLAIARYYKDWSRRGEGVGNFLTYGEFPNPSAGADNTARLFIPRGAILVRDLSSIQPVDLDDPTQVQEYVSHSWYQYGAGQAQPLHPYAGETRPNYTGPQPPYANLSMDAAYSWLKSPRWKGRPMEVGPLARVLMLYASGHAKTQTLVDGALAELKLPLTALFSTLGRVAARTFETKLIADRMALWRRQLTDNLTAGERRTHNADLFYPEAWPARAQGVGYTEAPRGALAHWVVIEDGRIANYQAVVPSTWNAGPRDAKGNEGPYEAALRGHPLLDPARPIEILRTIHSFDPCIACAVHVVDPDGAPLMQVKIN